jgi:hypothetical protein
MRTETIIGTKLTYLIYGYDMCGCYPDVPAPAVDRLWSLIDDATKKEISALLSEEPEGWKEAARSIIDREVDALGWINLSAYARSQYLDLSEHSREDRYPIGRYFKIYHCPGPATVEIIYPWSWDAATGMCQWGGEPRRVYINDRLLTPRR